MTAFKTLKSVGLMGICALALAASGAASAQIRPRPGNTGIPTDVEAGKGTIGMVCIDSTGKQVTWQQSGPANNYQFETCVQSVMDRVSEELIAVNFNGVMPFGATLNIRLDRIIRGLPEFQAASDLACRDKRLDLHFFY